MRQQILQIHKHILEIDRSIYSCVDSGSWFNLKYVFSELLNPKLISILRIKVTVKTRTRL